MPSKIYKRRVSVETQTATQTATGETVDWTTVDPYDRWAHIVPLTAEARAVYMQMQTIVTHKLVFHGRLDINYQQNRFVLDDDTVLTIVGPPQYIGQSTMVLCTGSEH